MKLGPDDVARIARLARLELGPAEVDAMGENLGAILSLIDALQAIPTEGVEPMAHVQSMTAPLREDRVTESDQHVLFQSVAPAVEDSMYLVPRVIE